jgi:SPP1 family predicted phage head-tail adaptor
MAVDRKINFYQPILTKSASGSEVKTYQLLSQPIAWAEVKWRTGKEKDEGKQRVATTGVEFKIRFRSDLTQVMVIEMEGIYYDILKINPLDRRQWLMIEAEQKDNDWQLPV